MTVMKQKESVGKGNDEIEERQFVNMQSYDSFLACQPRQKKDME